MAVPTPHIIRSFRRSISIHISPKGELLVKAPHFAPTWHIQKFVEEKADWIEKTIAKIKVRQKKEKEYKEGETFFYLGKSRKLSFYNGIQIKVEDDMLLFPKALEFRIQKELPDWFVKEAREKTIERLEYHAKEMNARYTGVFFSDTKSKWGTCFADNSLQFNWRLIMAPLMVLDYVVIHELVHTTEKNHGDRFWRRVRQYTPAYRQHRKWLNDNAHLLTV